ncbi:VOC family protein [Streptomyces sp. NPDC102402]|uniref:VOC family protein n=1 Tax=Streptomyces sp. NPDC102402 TaxID=3366169 RepID=UPI003806450D
MWNRVHLDVRSHADDDLEAEEARLRALGTVAPGIDGALGAVAPGADQSSIAWTVPAGPAGNEICLLAPR